MIFATKSNRIAPPAYYYIYTAKPHDMYAFHSSLAIWEVGDIIYTVCTILRHLLYVSRAPPSPTNGAIGDLLQWIIDQLHYICIILLLQVHAVIIITIHDFYIALHMIAMSFCERAGGWWYDFPQGDVGRGY